LSGHVADLEKGLQAIPLFFSTAFSYERNIRSWEKVGAVPFTTNRLKNDLVHAEVNGEQVQSLDVEKKHKEPYKLLQW